MVTTTTKHQHSAEARAAAGGLTAFACVLLAISGILDITRGVMAIAEDEIYLHTPDYVFKFDLTSWGWIHLSLGAVALAVSIGLATLAKWARLLGVAIASLLIIANFLSIPYYPFWSITLIAMYGFIIWGLCMVEPDSQG